MSYNLLKLATQFYRLSLSNSLKDAKDFTKLADCLPGDPLCGDIGDYKAEPLEPQKPSPKPAPKPSPKPAPKPDSNKADDGNDPEARSAIENVLAKIPGTRLVSINTASNQTNVEVFVPRAHTFTASQLSNTLSNAVGHRVVCTLST